VDRRSFLNRTLGAALGAAGAGAALTPAAASDPVDPRFAPSGLNPAPRAPASLPWTSRGPRPRLRDLGLTPGRLPPGPLNALTDVPGVRVGVATRIEDPAPASSLEPIRSGVTAILVAAPGRPASAGVFILNGNGEMVGTEEVRATGRLEAPILFTGTANIGRVYQGAMAWMADTYGAGTFFPPVVGETWDRGLSEVNSRPIGEPETRAAIGAAGGGPVAEGAVGGGTGMECYEFKGGNGTASRRVEAAGRTWTVGALVQANHGSRHELRVDGVPVGEEITDLMPEEPRRSKSILLLLATDAPLDGLQCERLARRAALGLARTGATSHHGSGDLVLAVSTTGARSDTLINDEQIDPLWVGAIEAVEEAILNALCKAVTMGGARGRLVHALPIDRLVQVLIRHGRLRPATESPA
jgi:D-aminopeptidase